MSLLLQWYACIFLSKILWTDLVYAHCGPHAPASLPCLIWSLYKHSNRHDGAPARSFLSQCTSSIMNGDREGILVHWPAESPIWFSGSSLCHVECEWRSNLRDLERNYTGCSTTSVQGFKTFSTYQTRTFSIGYNVILVCGRSHVQINIRPGTCYSEFSRCTPLLQAYAIIVPQIRTVAIFDLYFQTSTRNINYSFQLFVAVSLELLKPSLNEPQAEINYELWWCGLITWWCPSVTVGEIVMFSWWWNKHKYPLYSGTWFY
jgi:hypothetical protein